MSDWTPQDLENLLAQVDDLELLDPSTTEHPSNEELDSYVEERLSPFLRGSLEEHFERCERCMDYLAAAYERDAETEEEPVVVTGWFGRARATAQPWLAAAAVWIVALPLGVLLATSQMPSEPIQVNQLLSQTLAANEETPPLGSPLPAQTASHTPPPTSGDPPLTQAALDTALAGFLNTLGSRIQSTLAMEARLENLSPEDRQKLLGPYLADFVRQTSQQTCAVQIKTAEDLSNQVSRIMEAATPPKKKVNPHSNMTPPKKRKAK